MENRLKNCSRSEIGYLLGLHPSGVSRLRRQGLPINADGTTYDARAVMVWHTMREPELPHAGETEQSLEVLTRWRMWKEKRERLAYEREAGAVVDKAEALAYLNRRTMEFRSALDVLAMRLASQVTGLTDRVQVEQIVRVETYALEETFRRGNPYTDDAAAGVVDELGGLTPRMQIENDIHQKLFKEDYWKPKAQPQDQEEKSNAG